MADAMLEMDGRPVPINKDVLTLGRRTGNDVRLVEPDISREHAEVARDGERYVLRDRGSRFGTFVNNVRVEKEQVLKHGDLIRLGQTGGKEMVFLCEPVQELRVSAGRAADRLGLCRRQRTAAGGRPARGAAGARFFARAGRGPGAGHRLGDRTERRRARLHHDGGRGGQAGVQAGPVAGPRHPPRAVVRDQPQDSRGGLPDGRGPGGGRPARGRPPGGPRRHAGARHPPGLLHPAAPGPLPGQGRCDRPSRRRIGVLYLDSREPGRWPRPRCTRASRRWPPRPRSRWKTRASTARRWRRPRWSRS